MIWQSPVWYEVLVHIHLRKNNIQMKKCMLSYCKTTAIPVLDFRGTTVFKYEHICKTTSFNVNV